MTAKSKSKAAEKLAAPPEGESAEPETPGVTPDGIPLVDTDGPERIHAPLAELVHDIDEFTEHPDNPRHGDEKAIGDSLLANGQYRPIVVQQSTGHIVVGNHTRRAAKTLGWSKIAAVVQPMTDEQARRIMLADNRTSDLGTYDTEALTRELKKLPALDGTGFDQLALEGLLAELPSSNVPVEPQAPPSFGTIDPDSLETDHECPKCGYQWSGSSS